MPLAAGQYSETEHDFLAQRVDAVAPEVPSVDAPIDFDKHETARHSAPRACHPCMNGWRVAINMVPGTVDRDGTADKAAGSHRVGSPTQDSAARRWHCTSGLFARCRVPRRRPTMASMADR